MSIVAFSSTTALVGSAVSSRLLDAAQNVIARRLSTPNVTLSTPNVTLSTQYSKALNAKAPNSIYRNLTGLPPQNRHARDVHRTMFVRLTVECRLVRTLNLLDEGEIRYG